MTTEQPVRWDHQIMAAFERACRAGAPPEQLRDHVLGTVSAYVEAGAPIAHARAQLLEALGDVPAARREQVDRAAKELEATYLELASHMSMAVARAWYPSRPAAGVRP